jgi:hypothetical protein
MTSTDPVMGVIVIGVKAAVAVEGGEASTLDTPTAETSCHCTPVTVEVRT